MALFTDNWLTDLIGITIALAVIFITYYKRKLQYWKNRNFPYIEGSIPHGSVPDKHMISKTFKSNLQAFYNTIKANGWKHAGIYTSTSPIYIPANLDYVKNILTKDFQHFVDRGTFYDEKRDPLSAHLFNLEGTRWRNLRNKLSPTFTSGKMKMMFATLVECESSLRELMERERKKDGPVDIKEVLACFTTDIIGSCAFGLDFNAVKGDSSPFREHGRKLFRITRIFMLKRMLARMFPILGSVLHLSLVSKETNNFFMKVVEDTVKYRERNNFSRDDFMQLLIQLKNNNNGKEKGLTMLEIAAQCFVFFIAGFETSSTAMTFALYQLAKNPDIQEKLRTEINTVLEKHDGKITYEAIQEMKYMNQVLDETLRMYPPLPFLFRKCIKEYKFPDEDLVLEEGTIVQISILGIHYDEEHYPEPEKFDPERFSDDNNKSRHNYAHIPFGEGPRICIGLRFGLLQSKVGLVSLLSNYKFTVSKKTKEPITMSPRTAILSTDGEMWLDAEKL